MAGTTAPLLAMPLERTRPRRSLESVLDTPVCRVALAAGLIASLALVVVYLLVGGFTGQDLDVYRAGGAASLQGHRLYDSTFHTPTHLPFTYPPFAAAIFVPLSFLRHHTAIVAWDLCTLGAAGALIVVSLRSSIGLVVPRRWLPHCMVFGGALAASLAPIQDGLHEGQVGVFLALMCVSDVALPTARWRRGVLVGLATALKLTPGLFIVYFAVTREWKAFRASVVTVIGCWFATAIILPRDSFTYFGKGVIFNSSRVGKANDPLNESLNGLWHRLGVPAPTAFWIVSAVAVCIFGLWRAKRANERGDQLAAAVIIGFVSVLVAPVSWLHHGAWVVPAIAVLACANRLRFAARSAAIAVILVLVVPYGDLTGADMNVPAAYVETYVVLFLLIVALLPLSCRERPPI